MTSVSQAVARLACAGLALVALVPAHATEGGGGVYPYGLNTVASGILPKPGSYLYMYNSYFTADETMNDDGNAVPIDFDAEVRVHTLRFLHSFASAKVFGGGVGILVAQPYLVGDITAGPRDGSFDAFGDTTVGVMLGWHRPTVHWMTGVDVTMPTGSYSEDRFANAGRNYWAGTFYGSTTAQFAKRFDANARLNLTVNDTNSATDYRSGSDASLEWSVNCKFGKGWAAGLNGYFARQFTDDEIDGDPVDGTGRRLEVDAVGPQLIYRAQRWGGVAKWQHEMNARNKSEGDKYWLQFFVGL